ncbi:nuclease-related domain-containing protein [Comamonas sediminis]|uniref:Nuclease-related domain-containing protein n=1 Tax=Comamonas sediminis TaxID=1783360 RepID=A0ABV4B489_9BURK
MLANRIDLYIGSPIEHESERTVLIELLRLLEMSGTAATVLANVYLKGRQLDLVLGTDRLTLMLEAKSCTAPLRGSENGSWSTLTRSGRWKTTRNAYLQALDEKNALRDSLREHLGEVTGYPNAHVVFVPGLAPRSELPSDHKVTFGGIEEIADQLAQHSGLRCTAEQWRTFADRQRLERVFDLASAWVLISMQT